jgi:magnesium transporter
LGTDYLLYSLLDSVVDSYFPAMDRLNERLDLIEEEIMRGCRTGQMESIRQLRGDLLNVRRAIRPQAAPSIGAKRRSSMKSTASFS